MAAEIALPSRSEIIDALLDVNTPKEDLQLIASHDEALGRVPAAVLVALVNRPEGMSFLLTTRNKDLRHHAGQVSFPGGRIEDHDSGPVAAALRESREEIGLSADAIEVAGRLHDYHTISGFVVSPIVGFVSSDYSLVLDPGEVTDAFELPFSSLLAPGGLHRRHAQWQGQRRSWFALEYQQRVIWGVTAGIMVHLLERMGICPIETGEVS